MQLSPEPLHQFQPNLAQSIWVKGIQVFRNEEPRPFPRGNDIENLKIFLSRTTGSFSTKIGTMHPLVKGIQVCSNEAPTLLQGEIITK